MAEGEIRSNYRLINTDSADSDSYGSVPSGSDDGSPTGRVTVPLGLLTLLAAIGGFLFGYDTGVVSGAMLALKKVFLLNYFWQELVVSITIGGAVLFALIAGPLNDLLGRRGVILSASFIFTAGAIVMAAAPNKEVLLVGRLIIGIGIGLASMTVPMYIAECAPPQFRGTLTVVNNCFITGGQVIASILDGFFFSNKNGWRYMLGLAGIPAFVQFVGFLFMPESPRWLVMKGRTAAARRVLIWMSGTEDKVDENIAEIEEEREEAERSRASADSNSPVLWQMLRHASTRRALVLGCALQLFQQLGGINTVMYYSATIVEMGGVKDPQMAVWMAAVIAGVNFVGTFVGLAVVERVGRRKLTLLSLAGVAASLLLLGVTFHVVALTSPGITAHVPSPHNVSTTCGQVPSCDVCANRQDCGFCYQPAASSELAINASCLATQVGSGEFALFGPCDARHMSPNGTFAQNWAWAYDFCPSPYSWLPIIGMVVYLLCFSPGMGPMPWTINAEIYPTWARSTGMSASTATNWIFNLIVSMTFLTLTETLTRYGTFYLYAGIAVVGVLFFCVALPETRGKKLEDVELLFHRPWRCPCCKF